MKNILTSYNEIIEENLKTYNIFNIDSDLLIDDNDFFVYDFNDGFRFKFKDIEKKYKVIIRDSKTNYIYFTETITPKENCIYSYEKKYYIDYNISFHMSDEFGVEPYPCKSIHFDLSNQNVLIYITTSKSPAGLGDSIAWFNAIYEFYKEHKDSNIYVVTSYDELNEVLLYFCPEINIIDFDDVKTYKYYATYIMGCFFDDENRDYSPIPYNYQSLIEMGYAVLGIKKQNPSIPSILFNIKDTSINNGKPYVCMAFHASVPYKEWHPKNSEDRETLIKLIEMLGYDVFIIDKEDIIKTNSICVSELPKYGYKKTGDITLLERIKFLSNASFFVGVSSGLSWLAWSTGIPVVMVSGFTDPRTEFYTPFRVINYIKCNSCFNSNKNVMDEHCKYNFFNGCFMECSSSINANMIFSKILEIPEVKNRYE